MSTAVFNKTGQDSTEVEFVQFGNAETQTQLRYELLDGEKTYVFGVTSLNVPLQDCPIHPITTQTNLFHIRRRNVGAPLLFEAHGLYEPFNTYKNLLYQDLPEVLFQGFVAAYNVEFAALPGITEANNKAEIIAAFTPHFRDTFNPNTAAPLFDPTVFATDDSTFKFNLDPERPHFSVNDFMKTLSQFAEIFNQQMTIYGLEHTYFGLPVERREAAVANPRADQVVPYITFELNPDTSLRINGSRDFWDCFYFEFTDYGKHLLGISDKILTAVNVRSNVLGHQADSVISAANAMAAGNPLLFIAPANNTAHVVFNRVPLFECCDLRVYVAVTCHLPMDSHTAVVNGSESSSRDIAIAFFQNFAETSVITAANGDISLKVKERAYGSQTHMIRKVDQNIKWHKLKTSYRLRYIRLHLRICYKILNENTGDFSLQKQAFPVSADNYWQAFIRFVSEY
jgi:hypothetical protein